MGKESGKNDRSKCVIKKTLSYSDCFITFYKLKRIKKSTDLINIEDSTAKNLYKFMKSFKSSSVLFETDFDRTMSSILLQITSDGLEAHLMCLSLVPDSFLDFNVLREKFSYSKIFAIFKLKIEHIFSDGIDQELMTFLIKLLNNSKLVYKHIISVIQRLNMFLEKSIVDKSIVECSMIITSFGKGYFEVFTDSFTASILVYLVEFIHTPKSYLFIDSNASNCITDAISFLSTGLLTFKKPVINIKRISSNLLKDSISKIKEYRNSTVYEEAMVVVSTSSCISSLYKLFTSSGNDPFDIIEDNLFDFILFDKKKSNPIKPKPNDKSNDKNNDKLTINFDRPFKNHYNAHYQVLRDLFLVNKYRFLETISSISGIDHFNRIEFLNDLSKSENPQNIFLVLERLKSKLDWSDLIVFACNAPRKDIYLPLLFDEEFIKNSSHYIFLDIFLNHLKNGPSNEYQKLLIYFTKCAIKSNLVFILPELYLIELDKDSEVNKRRRGMIIEYLNGLVDSIKFVKTSADSILAVNSKEIKSKIETITLEDNRIEEHKTIKIKTIRSPTQKDNPQASYLLNFDLENAISNVQIQDFTSILTNEISDINMNLIPLLIVLASKKLNDENLNKIITKLFNKLNETAKEAGQFNKPETISTICIISIFIIIYKKEFFDKIKLSTLGDLLIAMISIKFCDHSDEYINKVKAQGFDILLKQKIEMISLIAEVNSFKDDSNKYIKDFIKIVTLITENEYLFDPILAK
jgi:hypothetical protein